MIISLFGIHLNLKRFLTVVYLLSIYLLIQSTILFVDASLTTYRRRPYSLLNKTTRAKFLTTTQSTSTISLIKTDNETNTTQTCRADIIDENVYYYSVGYRVFAGALTVPITICAIGGNILVIYVIKRYRSLRITGNIFLASLAFADVGVSLLAMTFYGLQLLYGRWLFGAFMCRLWFSCDVLFSTASIIHLACISFDRYLSIVRPFEYERASSNLRRYIMIFCCWFGSALLSFIPIFTGLYTTREQRRTVDCLNHVPGRCIFAVNQGYAIVSSLFSFWVPGAIMIIMYAMLIRIADKKEREAYQIMGGVEKRRRASQQQQYNTRRQSSDEQSNNELQRPNPLTKLPSSNGHTNKLRRQCKHDSLDAEMNRQPSVDIPANLLDPRNSQMKHLRRERRAVKTLGSIMLAFIICWLPFFVRYTACEPNRCNGPIAPLIADIVFWVGYFNSMINPFLYAFHNRDFRLAFKKTLGRCCICCRQRRQSTGSGAGLPSTPNVDSRRGSTNLKRLKNNKLLRSIASINDRQKSNSNFLSHGNQTLDTSNGNLTGGGYSLSSKRNSCL